MMNIVHNVIFDHSDSLIKLEMGKLQHATSIKLEMGKLQHATSIKIRLG